MRNPTTGLETDGQGNPTTCCEELQHRSFQQFQNPAGNGLAKQKGVRSAIATFPSLAGFYYFSLADFLQWKPRGGNLLMQCADWNSHELLH